ncbi:hypothetical protein GCM10010304_30450 [Streptomyces roseoviolaceus]
MPPPARTPLLYCRFVLFGVVCALGAALGFAVAVAGAPALSRFGEAPVESEGGAAEEGAVMPK